MVRFPKVDNTLCIIKRITSRNKENRSFFRGLGPLTETSLACDWPPRVSVCSGRCEFRISGCGKWEKIGELKGLFQGMAGLVEAALLGGGEWGKGGIFKAQAEPAPGRLVLGQAVPDGIAGKAMTSTS